MISCPPVDTTQVRVVYTGYGQICQKINNVFQLKTKKPKNKAETHAALITLKNKTMKQATITVTLNQQLRKNPNPWESPWVLFGYHNPDQFYYLAVKTNGWELGKRDLSYVGGQRFLITANKPNLSVDKKTKIKIFHTGNTIKLVLNKKTYYFTDQENPYLPAKLGFYVEDAEASFKINKQK